MSESTTVLPENLAYKIALALLHDGLTQPEHYGRIVARVKQVTEDVRAAELAPANAAGLTAQDALAIVSGSIDTSGGYRTDADAAAAFRQGTRGVYDAIQLQMRAGCTAFSDAMFAAKSALSKYENHLHSITQFDSLSSESEKAHAHALCDGATTANLLLEAAARHGLADGHVLAAHSIGTRRPLAPAPQEHLVTEERGEELLADLEEGIASPAAQHLHSLILTGNKAEALKLLADERMGGQNAEDLYAYCRQKWLGKRLTLVELPLEHAEEIVRKAIPTGDEFTDYGPLYLVRRGKSVAHCYGELRRGQVAFNLTREGWLTLKDIPQLWMVVEQA